MNSLRSLFYILVFIFLIISCSQSNVNTDKNVITSVVHDTIYIDSKSQNENSNDDSIIINPYPDAVKIFIANHDDLIIKNDTTIGNIRVSVMLNPSNDPRDLLGPYDNNYRRIPYDNSRSDTIRYVWGTKADIIISMLSEFGAVESSDWITIKRDRLLKVSGIADGSDWLISAINFKEIKNDTLIFNVYLYLSDSDCGISMEYYRHNGEDAISIIDSDDNYEEY